MNKQLLFACLVLLCFSVLNHVLTADDAISKSLDSTSQKPTDADTVKRASAIFAGGCFWCIESDFEHAPGVVEVIAGYSGGRTKSPKYTNYASGGHREVIFVMYDPTQVTYAGLVEFLLKHIDPTDRTGSFIDKGLQYSPAIYYETAEEKVEAQRVVKAIEDMKVFRGKLTIPILPRQTFWQAEDYHQDYHTTNTSKYGAYRATCGRDLFVRKIWGEAANQLTIPGAIPRTGDDPVGDKKEKLPASDVATSAVEKSSPWEAFKKPNDQELRRKLTAIQFEVTQRSGTEKAYRNPFWNHHAEGLFVDIVSGEPLFSSLDKFDSGTGWPSFVKPLTPKALTTHADTKEAAPRVEVRSRIADSHLGHVFNDGPPNRGGLRYCINSASLRFIPMNKLAAEGYGEYLKLFEE